MTKSSPCLNKQTTNQQSTELQSSNKYKRSPAVLALVSLLSLTLLAVYLAESNMALNHGILPSSLLSGAGLICLVTLCTIIKGQQIVDSFMGLKSAPSLWRRLLLSYIVVIPLLIAVIYLL